MSRGPRAFLSEMSIAKWLLVIVAMALVNLEIAFNFCGVELLEPR